MAHRDVSKKLQIFMKLTIGMVPEQFSSFDTSRLMIVFFGINALDLLDAVERVDKNEFIEWIYSHQILLSDKHLDASRCGFRGSNFIGCSKNPETVREDPPCYDGSHVTMVYTALCSLLCLGDDLSRVDRANVLAGVAALQEEDLEGAFKAGPFCYEVDLRFIFSAIASCFILDGFHAINVEAAVSFIERCQTYEGGFAQLPGLEAHAGATYCGIASLKLLDRLDCILPPGSRKRERTIRWLICLQKRGFHGRLGKPDDSCYTFWVGASLRLLQAHHLIEGKSVLQFASTVWNNISGGFSKLPCTSSADPMHTFLCLSGLSCLFGDWECDKGYTLEEVVSADVANLPAMGDYPNTEEEEEAASMVELDDNFIAQLLDLLKQKKLLSVCPQLNTSMRTFGKLKQLHASWTPQQAIQPVEGKTTLPQKLSNMCNI